MEITGTSPTNATSSLIDPDEAGFAGLTAEDFMKMLIVELQNQDPTEPIGNEDLLNQLAMMQNLQSNVELGDALTSFTSSQKLASAASFIGKSVTATDSEGTEFTALADRAFLRGGEIFIGSGDDEIPLKDISGITE